MATCTTRILHMKIEEPPGAGCNCVVSAGASLLDNIPECDLKGYYLKRGNAFLVPFSHIIKLTCTVSVLLWHRLCLYHPEKRQNSLLLKLFSRGQWHNLALVLRISKRTTSSCNWTYFLFSHITVGFISNIKVVLRVLLINVATR